ncbi:MAG: hypothetical protein L3K19_09550 [Thermoplasmata archaeon]|nr:hypothetical protein [Thermoplasmata archaeon]
MPSWTILAVLGALLMLGGWLFLVANVSGRCGPADVSCSLLDDPILGLLAFLFGGVCLAAGVFWWIERSWTRRRGGRG